MAIDKLISANSLRNTFRKRMMERFDKDLCANEENCKTCYPGCFWVSAIEMEPAVYAVEEPAVPGPEIADPNIMELCFHNGERHMKEKVITMLQDILDQEDGLCLIDLSEVIKAVEDL